MLTPDSRKNDWLDIVNQIAVAFGLSNTEIQTPERVGDKALWYRFDRSHRMTGREFEFFISDLYEALGYKSTVVGSTGEDYRVDRLLEKDGKRVAVQCKRYASPVGYHAVRDVFAGARCHDADEAWVVCPNGFQSKAKRFARRIGVVLLDRREIIRLIEQTSEPGTGFDSR